MTSCERCHSVHDGSFGSGRFCSSKCARSFSTSLNRKEINEKTSKTLRKLSSREKRKAEIVCLFCLLPKEVGFNKRHQKFCSRSCHTSFLNRDGLARRGGLASAAQQSTIRRSKNEIMFFELIKARYEDAESNLAIFDGWDADVVIPSIKVAIMWNGPWHHRRLFEGHKLEQVQNRDRIKIDRIRAHGYIPYIIKDDAGFDEKFVREQFSRFEEFIAGM